MAHLRRHWHYREATKADDEVTNMAISVSGFDGDWRLDKYTHFSKYQVMALLHKQCVAAGGPRATSMSKLISLKHRIDRGLTIYEASTMKELKNLARDRFVSLKIDWRSAIVRNLDKIDPHSEHKTCDSDRLSALAVEHGIDVQAIERETLIKRLTRADKHITFDRFQDLPPELRNKIYEYYVEEFKELLQHPTTPPLARINKVVRAEVLPIFYSRHGFLLYFVQRSGPIRRFRLCDETRLWLLYMPSEMVSRIRKLTVFAQGTQRRGKQARAWCSCTISLHQSGMGYDLGFKFDERYQAVDRFVNRIESEMRKVLGKVEVVNGRKSFKIEDLYALRDALDEVAKPRIS